MNKHSGKTYEVDGMKGLTMEERYNALKALENVPPTEPQPEHLPKS